MLLSVGSRYTRKNQPIVKESMQYLVTAVVTRKDRGLEQDTELVFPVMHPVEANSAEDAVFVLTRYYSRQSDDSPYGTRVSVSDQQAFASLSFDSIPPL